MARVPSEKLLTGLQKMCKVGSDEYWYALNEYVFKTEESHPRNAKDTDTIDDVIHRAIENLSDTDYQRFAKKVG